MNSKGQRDYEGGGTGLLSRRPGSQKKERIRRRERTGNAIGTGDIAEKSLLLPRRRAATVAGPSPRPQGEVQPQGRRGFFHPDFSPKGNAPAHARPHPETNRRCPLIPPLSPHPETKRRCPLIPRSVRVLVECEHPHAAPCVRGRTPMRAAPSAADYFPRRYVTTVRPLPAATPAGRLSSNHQQIVKAPFSRRSIAASRGYLLVAVSSRISSRCSCSKAR
jgi:hypothetical protein